MISRVIYSESMQNAESTVQVVEIKGIPVNSMVFSN